MNVPTQVHPHAEHRWECDCRPGGVLLGTTCAGTFNAKAQARMWQFAGNGEVRAVCPRCGRKHLIALHGSPSIVETAGSNP